MNRKAIALLAALPLLGILFFLAGWVMQFGSDGAYRDSSGRYLPISTESSLGHVAAHPAFAGFGRFLLPWQSGSTLVTVITNPLALGKLLPRVGPFQPDVVADGINLLIDAVNKGDQIYYPIYTEAELDADPSRRNTGLFFLKGDPGAPFAFLIPGGGFVMVAAIQEGFPVARVLHDQGYNVFILQYRVREPDGKLGESFFREGLRIANEDLARAMQFVFANAERLQVNPQRSSLWGFSAGGMIAGDWLNPQQPGNYKGRELPAPATVVIGYSARFEQALTTDFPPLFMVSAVDDDIIPIEDVDALVGQARERGVAVKYLRLDRAGHGFGTGAGTLADGWMREAIMFWESYQ